MQVAHAQDHITHAFLGAKQSRAVGISDDPAFFQILSSTLYKDQKLAVVRETLCNAWDAHIEAGKIDTPIEITIDEEEMVIRDFGHGIPDDLMQPIYGVYGASTKKSNKNVTGGFGLGCKAPWSYTEHFEVASFNGGTKTIYNMSRSSAEVGGRPDITPIASFPTTETGLQVTIPLATGHDRLGFENLIREVVRNGEIKATLNGNKLDVLPFSESELGYIIIPGELLKTRINVRYGNVIYPVDMSHSGLIKLLDRIGFRDRYGRNSAIVLQAPADSLSITPSRETLSMTDQTKETLTRLMDEAFTKTIDEVNRYERELTREHTSKLSATPNDLFDLNKSVLDGKLPLPKNFLTTTKDIALAVLYRSLWNYPGPSREDLMQRAKLLDKADVYDRSLLRSYRYALRLDNKLAKHRAYNQPDPALSHWLFTRLINPMKSALAARGLPTSRLKYGKHFYYDAGLQDLNYVFKLSPQEAFPLLRKFVVVAFSKSDISDRLGKFPAIEETHGTQDVFTYIVPRSYTRMTALREAFAEAGMTVLDLTVAQPWEKSVVLAPVAREKRDTKDGIPVLSGLYRNHHIHLPRDPACSDEITERTEAPKYIIQLARGMEQMHLNDDFDDKVSRTIIKLFGDETGVTISSTQHQAWIKKGAKDLTQHLEALVLEEYKTNKRIRDYIARDFTRLPYIYRQKEDFLLNTEQLPAVQQLFGLSKKLKERDWQILGIARALINNNSSFTGFGAKMRAVIAEIPVDTAFSDSLQKLMYSELLDALCLLTLSRKLNSTNPETARKAIAVLKSAVKG